MQCLHCCCMCVANVLLPQARRNHVTSACLILQHRSMHEVLYLLLLHACMIALCHRAQMNRSLV